MAAEQLTFNFRKSVIENQINHILQLDNYIKYSENYATIKQQPEPVLTHFTILIKLEKSTIGMEKVESLPHPVWQGSILSGAN